MAQVLSNNAKLLELINTWDIGEWKRVAKLAESGYVQDGNGKNIFRNKSKECLALLIKKHRQLARLNELSYELFKKNTRYAGSKGDWQNFTSELLKICRTHIQLSHPDEEAEMSTRLAIQRYFSEQNLWANYDSIDKENHELVFHPAPLSHFKEGLWKVLLSEIRLFSIRTKEQRGSVPLLGDLEKGMFLFFHETLLRSACTRKGLENHQKINVESIHKKPLQNLPEFLEEHSQIDLYSLAYQLRVSKDDRIFDKLLARLNDECGRKPKQFDISYLEPLYVILQSHCVIRSRDNNNETANHFRRAYLDIAYKLLAEGRLLEQGRLHSSQFKNIIISHLKLKEDSKAAAFSAKYLDTLLGEEDTTIRYCHALRKYQAGKYEEVFSLLDKLPKNSKHEDYVMVDIKLLYLLACLELNRHEPFLKELKNARQMVGKRPDVAGQYVGAWKRSLDYINDIYQVPRYKIAEKYPIFIKKIKKDNYVRHDDWLISYMERKLTPKSVN